VDADLLCYVWDGGSSHEYVSPSADADNGRTQPDSNLALTSLSHSRLSTCTLDSPGAR